MWARPGYWKGRDVEAAGTPPLYPMMLEPAQLRWAFIRKIYTILAGQMLLTVAVAAVVVSVPPVSRFFVSSGAGLGLYIFLIILPFIVLCPLYYYYQQHPLNFLLLGVFTVSISFAVGLTCAFTSGSLTPLTPSLPFLYSYRKSTLKRLDSVSNSLRREGDSRISNPHGSRGGEPHALHLLGCFQRP
ncbi:hypothetical protein BHM03_00026988 [Ensete ventricosum]|nr:hypothetical protein BHM03_00026988 [Ensete ventricosum]